MAAHLLLQETAFSRNRNFEVYTDPRYRRAIALYRRLRALISDLERYTVDGASVSASFETHAGRPSVRLQMQAVSARGQHSQRTSWLERPAFDVLMLHPTARKILAKVAA
jgi:hypothetical protein